MDNGYATHSILQAPAMQVAEVNGVVGQGSLRDQAYPHSQTSLVFSETDGAI